MDRKAGPKTVRHRTEQDSKPMFRMDICFYAGIPLWPVLFALARLEWLTSEPTA